MSDMTENDRRYVKNVLATPESVEKWGGSLGDDCDGCLNKRDEIERLAARLAEAEALLREARAGDQLHWKRWRAWQAEVDAFLADSAPAAREDT